MGKAGTSAEALIELLNLCEQTLTALNGDYADGSRGSKSDQERRSERIRRSKIVRSLYLIKGGLFDPGHRSFNALSS
jgi:hypothetical protein